MGIRLQPRKRSKAASARLPRVETNADLDLPPTLHETIRAVQQLVAVRVSLPSAFVTLLSCSPHTPCRYAAGTHEAGH
nr:unnamed protein product [Spirometra erinaceieuropaei]